MEYRGTVRDGLKRDFEGCTVEGLRDGLQRECVGWTKEELCRIDYKGSMPFVAS
jgi:hypothetical protein